MYESKIYFHKIALKVRVIADLESVLIIALQDLVDGCCVELSSLP